MAQAGKRLWWGCLAAGLATFALSFWFRTVRFPEACVSALGEMPPLLAFQFARSHEELLRVFGTADSQCRPVMVAALDRMDMVDLFLFIPAYGLFLLLFVHALAGRPLTHLARAAVAAVVIAVACDVAETVTQLRMTQDIDGVNDFWLLELASVGKFLMLGVSGMLAGLLAWRERHRIAGGAMVAGGGLALAMLALGLVPMIAIGLAIYWVAALATALWMSVRGFRQAG